ncbi:MAG TPA: hypothetical protein VFT50_01455 [Baekduia sp.]|nr:hypothetical protein [Baekduia sp.]
MSGMVEPPRVVLTVTTRWQNGSRFHLTLDAPRGDWGLVELHELGHRLAQGAAMTSETTTSMEVTVTWPETAGPSIER